MKITQKQLRRLIRESIMDTISYSEGEPTHELTTVDNIVTYQIQKNRTQGPALQVLESIKVIEDPNEALQVVMQKLADPVIDDDTRYAMMELADSLEGIIELWSTGDHRTQLDAEAAAAAEAESFYGQNFPQA